MWQKVHAKRMATGIKQPFKIGKDRSHLLTGILKCPLCGSSMYTNKHAWTNKDGTYKEVYYYICGRNKQERGHHCDYKASLRKTDIEPLVIEAVKELVSDKYFAKEIEKRIGVQTDTTAIDKELANYESKLKEVDLNKARLEREIDNLPIAARFRERKIHDMTLRLDGLYDTIVELEERIEDAKLRKSSIEMETITLDNIYKLMLNFGTLKIYSLSSSRTKTILDKLENNRRKEYVPTSEYTIEHIMPQTLSDDWKSDLGADANRIHETYVHTIGNLTLTGYNSEYQNKRFSDKVDCTDKAGNAIGYRHTPIKISSYLTTVSKWGEDEILARAEMLSDELITIWKYPKKD